MVKRWIAKRLFTVGFRISRSDAMDPLVPALNHILRRQGRIFFVQIGANDGISLDPIHEFVVRHHASVSGLALEPLPDVFEQLVATYKAYPNVTPLQLAIHNSEAEMTLWRCNPSTITADRDWARGIASFDPDHHLASGTPKADMIPVRVPCISLAALLDERGIRHVDLLQIDTEGYDREILCGIDFEVMRPTVIHFEHGLPHGIMNDSQLSTVLDRLHAARYSVFLSGYDATAIVRELGLAS
jgi:FkbM family methyltransferase